MSFTITQAQFEQSVPSFRDVEGRTFGAILPYIQRWCDAVFAEFRPDQYIDHLQRELADTIYLAAAHEALPHLDLVLTDNGFAVVRNNNLAPASRDRVAALDEQLRRQKSDARDRLLLALNRQISADGSDRRDYLHLGNLLYCPAIARRHGVRMPDGSEVYAEEYAALTPAIMQANEAVGRLISPEQVDFLMPMQPEYDGPEHADTSCDVVPDLIRRARYFMAAHVNGDKAAASRAARDLKRILLHYESQGGDELQPYRQSSLYQADHFTPYQNQPDDPTFFFG